VCEVGEDSLNCALDCPAPICGDGICGQEENPCSCSIDCGPAGEEVCNNGVDDDCDGTIDCDDSDCALVVSCICLVKNESCRIDGDCCSGLCKNGKCR